MLPGLWSIVGHDAAYRTLATAAAGNKMNGYWLRGLTEDLVGWSIGSQEWPELRWMDLACESEVSMIDR